MPIDKFQGGYRWLSNFHPAPIEWDDIVYKTSEHCYQALKTNDQIKRLEISQLKTAGQAKRFGKTLEVREDWNKVRVDIMEAILRKKFPSDSKSENYHLTQDLVMTGAEELIEGNDWKDYFWGVCDGEGENLLGKLLMKIRAQRSKYV